MFPSLATWLERRLLRERARGVEGIATLKELVALRLDGTTDSALEVKIRRALRATNLPRPTLRHVVFDQHGYVMPRLRVAAARRRAPR